MANENSKISYFNTLIFTIVSGIISLLLLLALFFEVGRDYAYLIITIEIGIFSIIALCIFQIIRNERRIAAAKIQRYNKISFQKCPDYFEMSTNGDNVTECKNNFTIIYPDGSNKKILIHPGSDNFNFPEPYNSTNLFVPSTTNAPLKYNVFNLYATEQSDKLKDAAEQCKIIMNNPLDNDTNLAEFKHYSDTPWTYARSRCEQYLQ